MLIQNRYDETRIIGSELIATASPRKNMKGGDWAISGALIYT